MQAAAAWAEGEKAGRGRGRRRLGGGCVGIGVGTLALPGCGRGQGAAAQGEPGGAVALAAVLAGRVAVEPGMLVILSGGNVDMAAYARVLAGDVA